MWWHVTGVRCKRLNARFVDPVHAYVSDSNQDVLHNQIDG